MSPARPTPSRPRHAGAALAAPARLALALLGAACGGPDPVSTTPVAERTLEYTVAELPGIGGADAGAASVNARGDVAGWARDAGGRVRPVLWQGGVARVLPAPDTADVRARRVNAAGDVLGEGGGLARVWRADGQVLTVGPVAGPAPYFGRPVTCCTVAGDLSDGRVVVASNRRQNVVALFDVASGETRLLPAGKDSAYFAVGVTRAGEVVANRDPLIYSPEYVSTALFGPTLTLTAPGPPPSTGQCEGSCARRTYNQESLAVGDNGAILLCVARAPAVSLPGVGGRRLELPNLAACTYWPTSRSDAAAMDRAGTRVAVLDTAGGLYVVTLPDLRAARVVAGEALWRLDAVGGVGPTGVIVGHGRHAATGRTAALVLTPRVPR